MPSFFVPTSGDLTVQEPPSLGIYHPRHKNANAQGSARGGGGGGKNCFDNDIVICCFKLTELTSFDFHYNGAVAPRAMALGCTYSRVVLI